ncbi:hypothetical protein [Nonomuraea angiospora]
MDTVVTKRDASGKATSSASAPWLQAAQLTRGAGVLAYQQIPTVFGAAGGSMRARELALTRNDIQNLRAKLKGLANRGVLVKAQVERRPTGSLACAHVRSRTCGLAA